MRYYIEALSDFSYSLMVSRKTRSLLVTLIVILGCGVAGFVFWASEEYRALTPLVFILGAVILFIPWIKYVFKFFLKKPKSGMALKKWANKQRSRADERLLWSRGTPQLVANLYFGHIKNYPEWIRESRDYVPSSITNAGRTEQGSVRLLLFYADYIFQFRKWIPPNGTDDRLKKGVLEITREGDTVFVLRTSQKPNKKGIIRWQPTSIELFQVGVWIKDFENLQAEILAILKDRAREARES